MPEPASYEYAVVRVVPRVDRQEFVNAGVIVFAKQQKLLQARTYLNEKRLRALWPSTDLETVRRHLDALDKVCAGDTSAGSIAKMSQSERFHWLTSPKSTMIQMSPVHTGLSSKLDSLADELTRNLVEIT